MTAPIALFTYNRPEHTQKTIESLLANTLSSESTLYIFSDEGTTEQDKILVQQVRAYLKCIEGFKDIVYTFHQENQGLAHSIINGVSHVLEAHDTVIVLEDDLETSPSFLSFMNEALSCYNPEKVWSIAGYAPSIQIPSDYTYDTYLVHRNCSWGWATWKQNWHKTDWKVSDFSSFFVDPMQRKLFNRGGNDMAMMLLKQQKSIIHSWSIRFQYAAYKNNLPSVYPTKSLIKNLGVDGSGTNMKKSRKYGSKLNLGDNTSFHFCPATQLNSHIEKRFRKFYNTSLYRSMINLTKTLLAVQQIKKSSTK